MRRRDRLTPAAMIVLLGGSGILHVIIPDGDRRIVPHVLGHEREFVAVTGVAEIVCAAMMLAPATRRSGGWLTAALVVAVFPAKAQMALDGGLAGAGFPLGNAVVAWARLPLQLPLVWGRRPSRSHRQAARGGRARTGFRVGLAPGPVYPALAWSISHAAMISPI